MEGGLIVDEKYGESEMLPPSRGRYWRPRRRWLTALRAKVIWVFPVLPGVGPLTGQPQANIRYPVGVVRMARFARIGEDSDSNQELRERPYSARGLT